MAINRALVTLKIVTEHFLNKLHARIHASRIAGKGGEQLKLRCRKVDFFVFNKNFMTRNINNKLTKVEHLKRGFYFAMSTTQKRTYTSHKLTRRERLNEIIVGTQLKTNNPVFYLTFCGKHNNRDVRSFAHGTTYALARKFGQHKVEDNKIE